MEKKYFTLAGTCYHFGQDFMEPKMQLTLRKEPDNEYDKEAIRCEMEGLGLVGYVANSVSTVKGESMSGGRLYDKIGDTAEATILYVLPDGVICYINEE